MLRYGLWAALICTALSTNLAHGDCPHCNGSGCCYEEVIKYRCVQVPDVKPVKKVFYECKCVPYCLPSLPPLFGCECESGCEKPRMKRVLVKREVEVGETCGTKCVVESYVERVAVPCCHCGHSPDRALPAPVSSARRAK